jgi:hypothetical protein
VTSNADGCVISLWRRSEISNVQCTIFQTLKSFPNLNITKTFLWGSVPSVFGLFVLRRTVFEKGGSRKDLRLDLESRQNTFSELLPGSMGSREVAVSSVCSPQPRGNGNPCMRLLCRTIAVLLWYRNLTDSRDSDTINAAVIKIAAVKRHRARESPF